MPVQIGARSHSFSDPRGLLSDCHRRIEMFLSILERIGSVIESPPTEDTRTALESALRYFREAAPKHTADEEESLFPRLRQMHLSDVESAIERLELLENDHVLAGSLHAEVEELGQRYLAAGSLESTGVEAFRNAIARLVSIYKGTSASRTPSYFLWQPVGYLLPTKRPSRTKWLAVVSPLPTIRLTDSAHLESQSAKVTRSCNPLSRVNRIQSAESPLPCRSIASRLYSCLRQRGSEEHQRL